MIKANIQESVTYGAYDRKKYFQEKLLDRIRDHIGLTNIDQTLKEEILIKICSKITSVYVGCFDKIEQALGEEIWAYKVAPEVFNKFTLEEQEMYKRRAKIWGDCRTNIKDLGNKVIDDVICTLREINFIDGPEYVELLEAYKKVKK